MGLKWVEDNSCDYGFIVILRSALQGAAISCARTVTLVMRRARRRASVSPSVRRGSPPPRRAPPWRGAINSAPTGTKSTNRDARGADVRSVHCPLARKSVLTDMFTITRAASFVNARVSVGGEIFM